MAIVEYKIAIKLSLICNYCDKMSIQMYYLGILFHVRKTLLIFLQGNQFDLGVLRNREFTE